MNLKEIVFRSDKTPIQQEESLFLIKEYIKARRGVDVNPEIDTRFGYLGSYNEIRLMHEASISAIIWFRENPEYLND
jgi:hypothetical protein